VPPRAKRSNGKEPLGFEDVLWKAADKLRGSMDASEYKHVVLGLIFLKYVEDAFEERQGKLRDELAADGVTGEQADELLESRDEYTAEGVFWVPPEARWGYLRERAKQPEIGKLIDSAMDLIELDNPSLRGVLPKTYARPSLDVRRLGELVDLISSIGLGAAEHREKDILGRVYEYFLGRFASSEGKGGGEFYTPRSVVRLLVEMIEPYSGRVYDPCCGSGGMFVQAERFVEAHGGRRNDIAVYGQELNDTTWRLAKMNLAIRGIEADLGPRWGDSFHEDLHPDLKADYMLANPPFNISDWGGDQLGFRVLARAAAADLHDRADARSVASHGGRERGGRPGRPGKDHDGHGSAGDRHEPATNRRPPPAAAYASHPRRSGHPSLPRRPSIPRNAAKT
jgi:type I restriction enzyme M protein